MFEDLLSVILRQSETFVSDFDDACLNAWREAEWRWCSWTGRCRRSAVRCVGRSARRQGWHGKETWWTSASTCSG